MINLVRIIKKHKKLCLSVFLGVFLLVTGVFITYKYFDYSKDLKSDKYVTASKKTKDKKEKVKSKEQKEEIKEKQQDDDSKKDDIKSDKVNVTNNSNKNNTKNNKQSSSTINNSNPITTKTEIPQTSAQPVTLTEWEKLGISEYDYKHTKLFSWEEIAFDKIEDCQREAQRINNQYSFVTNYGDVVGKYVNYVGCWIEVYVNGNPYYLNEFRALGYQ